MHLWQDVHKDLIICSRDMNQTVKNAPSCNVETAFKKFLDPDQSSIVNV